MSAIPPPTPTPVHAPRQDFWERLLKINRRFIYLVVAVAVALPLFIRFTVKPGPMPPVIDLFNTIDTMPRNKALVLSVDYDPGSEAELQPMTIALLRHAFAHHAKVGVVTLYLTGMGLADTAIRQVVGEFNSRAKTPQDSLRYGVDYVFWGFQPVPLMVIAGMGEDVRKVFPTDVYNNRTDTLPISDAIRNYRDVGIVVSLSSSEYPLYWVTYGQTVFGVKVGAGITAVMAADWYPYYSKTRQFSGILAGMKGASEYEQLTMEKYPATVAGLRRVATERMSSQTTGHLAIMLLIIVGNIAFFATRKRRKPV
jgi:hypothetical protein